jgi:hypothetical protein
VWTASYLQTQHPITQVIRGSISNEGEYQQDLDRIFSHQKCEDEYTTTSTTSYQAKKPPTATTDFRVFPYASLRAPGPYPSGVDVAYREQHLDDAQFESLLKMPRSQWVQVPPWKQQKVKKALGLF